LKADHAAIVPILCDITDQAQVDAMGAAVRAQTESLEALVNNAGTAYAAPMELIPPDVLLEQIKLNVIAHVAVTQAVMGLLKAAKGTIINVSSVGGKVTSPLMGPYSASKFALEAISDALRLELAHFGVKVVVIEPGSSPTAIWQTSLKRALAMLKERKLDISPYQTLVDMLTKSAEERSQVGFPPQLFADTVEKVLNTSNPRPRYAIPGEISRLIFMRRFMPDTMWDGIVHRNSGW
jgi:NAD(P)-dependent dehydrogenase (short-subunit alcohol dehydrogenase family)